MDFGDQPAGGGHQILVHHSAGGEPADIVPTPPFGFALFYMKGIAPKEIKIQSIYKGIVPFVILQALGVVTVMIFPQVALWLMHSAYG